MRHHKRTKPQGSIRTNELAYLIIPQSRPGLHVRTTHIGVRILVCRSGLAASLASFITLTKISRCWVINILAHFRWFLVANFGSVVNTLCGGWKWCSIVYLEHAHLTGWEATGTFLYRIEMFNFMDLPSLISMGWWRWAACLWTRVPCQQNLDMLAT